MVGLLRAWRCLGFGAGVSRYVIIWRYLGRAWVTGSSVRRACLWCALGAGGIGRGEKHYGLTSSLGKVL